MRSSIDYNILVDLPENAHICSDHRVYIVLEKRYYQQLGYNLDSRLWLGKAVSEKQMHPNENYKERYREQLEGIQHLNLPEYTKRLGLYCVCLSISLRNGLYGDLNSFFGPENANLIMDYAMYSISEKSNVAKDYQGAMTGRMLFLGKAYSDSWIQEKFSRGMTDNQIQAFKIQWLKRCGETGISDAWICIDGSNNDCNAQIEEAEEGNAKSHKNTSIISFMYAVDQNGKPILSKLYRGGRVDSKELSEMTELLKQCGIRIKGIVLDRVFCDRRSIEYVENAGYDYVVMMKENTQGYRNMLSLHRDALKLTWKTALGNGLYGITDTVQLFSGDQKKACVALIWDSRNGIERSNFLVDEIIHFLESAEKQLADGHIPVIPVKYEKYLKVETDSEKHSIVVQEMRLQDAIFGKGYYALASSKVLTAKEINDIYDLRDASEKQYAMLKTQLGYRVFRAHQIHGIHVRENISFVASIIRNEMLMICKQLKIRLDLNKGLKELDLVTMNMGADSRYHAMHNCSERQTVLLNAFQVQQENLDYVTEYENKRINGEMISPVQSISDNLQDSTAETSTTRRINGIPDGSRAKGSSVRLRATAKPGRRGRPPKNVQPAGSNEQTKKKGRGRPKGSKNKPKADICDMPKRGRGRPKGSKNKPKADRIERLTHGSARPKESKNNAK